MSSATFRFIFTFVSPSLPNNAIGLIVAFYCEVFYEIETALGIISRSPFFLR